jgi:predicted GTPase
MRTMIVNPDILNTIGAARQADLLREAQIERLIAELPREPRSRLLARLASSLRTAAGWSQPTPQTLTSWLAVRSR